MVIFTLASAIVLPFVFFSQTAEITEVVDHMGGNKTTATTTVTTTPHEISATYFIIPGLGLLILLLLMLRKVNLGPLGLELADPVAQVIK